MNRKKLQWTSRLLIATGGVLALSSFVGLDPKAWATEPVCNEGEIVYRIPDAFTTVLEEGKTVTIDTGLVVPVGKDAHLSSYFSWGGYLFWDISLNGPAQTWRIVLGSGATGYTADPADGADNFLVKGDFNATLPGNDAKLVIEHSSVQNPTGVTGANAIFPIGFCYSLTNTPTTSTTSTTTTSTTTVAPTTVPPTTVAPTTLPPTTLPPATVPPFIVPPASTIAPATTAAPTTTVLPSTSTAAPTTAPLVSVAGVTVVQTTVPAPPAAPAEVKAGELAYTGSGSNGLTLVLAALLIGSGSTLLLVGRRRN